VCSNVCDGTSVLHDAGLDAATAERLARDPINYQVTALDRDIAAEMGIRSTNDARPDINSPVYKAWATSKTNRDAARGKLEEARMDLNTAHGDVTMMSKSMVRRTADMRTCLQGAARSGHRVGSCGRP
jgi:hypothetical protein